MGGLEQPLERGLWTFLGCKPAASLDTRIEDVASIELVAFCPYIKLVMQTISRVQCLRTAGARRRWYSVLPSLLSTSSPEFRPQAEGMDGSVEDLKAKLAQARQGGRP